MKLDFLKRNAIIIVVLIMFGITGLVYYVNLLSSKNKPIPELLNRRGNISNSSEWLNTKKAVAGLLDRIRKNPEDYEAKVLLALAYIQEAKITGEHPYYYPAALNLLDDVLNAKPDNQDLIFQATVAKGSVHLSQHQFTEALKIGNEALKLNSRNADVYGILTDANVELGNYNEAVKNGDLMVSIRPDIRSYARISYLRQIYGDMSGAIEAMKLAVSAGYPGLEQTAWARVTLARLYELNGNLKGAESEYLNALAERSNYAFAIAGLGNIAKSHKDYNQAVQQLKKACNLIPEVSFYQELISVYQLQNKIEEAKKLSQEVIEMYREDEESGHIVYLELAGFYREAMNDPKTALQIVENEFKRRPQNIDVRKEMASIYYMTGNYAKAQEHLAIAMRTKSQDPTLLCLAGLVYCKQNNNQMGIYLIKKSLTQNPYIDNKISWEAKKLLTNSTNTSS